PTGGNDARLQPLPFVPKQHRPYQRRPIKHVAMYLANPLAIEVNVIDVLHTQRIEVDDQLRHVLRGANEATLPRVAADTDGTPLQRMNLGEDAGPTAPGRDAGAHRGKVNLADLVILGKRVMGEEVE